MTPEVERAIAFIRHQQCDAGKIIADYAEFADKEIERLRALLDKSRAALQLVVGMAGKAYDYWDADEDHKVGKILMALAGRMPLYCPDTDIIDSVRKELIDELAKGK